MRMKRIQLDDNKNVLFGMAILDSKAKEGRKGATIYATDCGTMRRTAICSYSDERKARQILARLNEGR